MGRVLATGASNVHNMINRALLQGASVPSGAFASAQPVNRPFCCCLAGPAVARSIRPMRISRCSPFGKAGRFMVVIMICTRPAYVLPWLR